LRRRIYLFTASILILVSYLVAQRIGWIEETKGPITGFIADAKTAREHDKIAKMQVCENAVEPGSVRKLDVLRAYPRRAINRGLEGQVKAKLRVDDTDKVRDVMILDNIPINVFDEAVEREAMKMTYEPAEPACKGKIRIVDLLVEFKLEN
jgi:TonB family protein